MAWGVIASVCSSEPVPLLCYWTGSSRALGSEEHCSQHTFSSKRFQLSQVLQDLLPSPVVSVSMSLSRERVALARQERGDQGIPPSAYRGAAYSQCQVSSLANPSLPYLALGTTQHRQGVSGSINPGLSPAPQITSLRLVITTEPFEGEAGTPAARCSHSSNIVYKEAAGRT